MSIGLRSPAVLAAVWLGLVPAAASGADWPQFMRDAAHTGDAAGEVLRLPLGLAARVQLDDAILTSPAVVGGRVYVVDQMGTACCVDPKANRVLWKSAPDGKSALGGNTSSPCIVKGRMYYGTTAGRVHILDCRDGKKVASIDLKSPVPGALTHANGSLYFQTLDARLVRMSLDGRVLWTHDHYRKYKWPGRPSNTWPRGFHKNHYAGGEVAVSGKRVVASIGCDRLCLEDLGTKPKIAWCHRSSVGQIGPAIVGKWVYFAQPHNDGQGAFFRVRLADGTSDRKTDRVARHWLPLAPPAVRGQTVFVSSHSLGLLAYDFAGAAHLWRAFDRKRRRKGLVTPGVASPALSRDHCVFATVRGEVYVVGLKGSGTWKKSFQPRPFRFTSGEHYGSRPTDQD